MRYFITTIVITSVLGGAAAQEDDGARAILERAIKAHGGKKNIMKLRIAKVNYKFWLNVPGEGVGEVTVNDTYQLPNQFMKITRGKIVDMNVDLTWAVVSGGEKWWHREGNGETVLHNERRDILTLYRPYLPLEQLVLMLESKDAKLKSLGEKLEKKQKLLGLHFSSKTAGTTDLFFDKATNRLLLSRIFRSCIREL